MKHQALIFAILALGAGYGIADAYDVTPGILTMREAEPKAQPYPSISVPHANSETQATKVDNAQASMPNATEVQAILDAFVNDKTKVVGNVSALVVDAETGETLGKIAPDTPRIPASNMKMVTALAAMSTLDPNEKFPTTVTLEGDNLYLVGGGDPLLAVGDARPHEAYGHGSITELAQQTAKKLKNQGTTSLALHVDSTLFDAPLYQESIDPSTQPYVMQARPLGTKESAHTELFGADPDLRVAQLFAEELTKQGITITSHDRLDAPSPATAQEIARVESASVRQLVDYMLTYSDNSTAETLAHLVAIKRGKAATFKGGGEATREALGELEIDTQGAVFADGSGLSKDNRLTARTLIAVTDQVWRSPEQYAPIASGLPVGGYNGTLSGRFTKNDMGGLVHAKTGSLPGVSSLSGFLQTKEGRILEFAFIVDEIPNKSLDPATGQERITPDVRPAIDEALGKIAAL